MNQEAMKKAKDKALELAEYFSWDEKSEQVREITIALFEAYTTTESAETLFLKTLKGAS